MLCHDNRAHQTTTTPSNNRVDLLLQVEHGPVSHLIPRIVHQEFRERIRPWRHAELDRFQNSWRATGWDYRFYTPSMARDFVRRHYPALVLQVYDSPSLRGHQSGLFRLLVLLKEGGIYADMDVLLETNLDSLLTGGTGFAAARDDAKDDSRSHCLWNGIVAARPGHPFVARAVATILNAVLNEWDENDLEAQVCSSRSDSVWKVRAATWQDNILGSCALGMAVHSALGESTLGEFRPGIIPLSENGTSERGLILMVRAIQYGGCWFVTVTNLMFDATRFSFRR